MKIDKSDRGFKSVHHECYPPGTVGDTRVITESSVVGDYDDALEHPGSSALWIGFHHHLNREEVQDLMASMQHWLDHKRLPDEVPPPRR